MTLKRWLGLLFIISTASFIFLIYHSSHEAEEEIIKLTSGDVVYDEFLDMNPGEIYALTIKNTLPEIKMLSALLFFLLILAFSVARFEIASGMTKEACNRLMQSMVLNRDEKLEAIRVKERNKKSMQVSNHETLQGVIDKLEESIKNRNPHG
jgi:hypothetical protein